MHAGLGQPKFRLNVILKAYSRCEEKRFITQSLHVRLPEYSIY